MTPGDITTDKMKTDNELIAEFMGYSEEAQRTDLWCSDFHENWSALMPVVEKIETLGFSTRILDVGMGIEGELVIERFGKTKIEGTYKTVIEFIKWYNAQKP